MRDFDYQKKIIVTWCAALIMSGCSTRQGVISSDLSLAGANELKIELKSISQRDQSDRLELERYLSMPVQDSQLVRRLYQRMLHNDSVNVQVVCAILDKSGWPDIDSVGQEGSETVWLVLQHAPLDVQESYSKFLYEAVKSGNLDKKSGAYFDDRLSVRKGERQKYGTQLLKDPESGKSFVLPLADFKNVDSIRRTVGLPPLRLYLKETMDIEWNDVYYSAYLDKGLDFLNEAKKGRN